MKCYTFIHGYIKGIQVGIQAGHAIVELMNEHKSDPVVEEWASDHKTFVWLDGGDSNQMRITQDILADIGSPYAVFREPAMSCGEDDGGMVTAISVVLTTEQVDAIDNIRNNMLKRKWVGGGNKPYIFTDDFDITSNPMTRPEANFYDWMANARSKNL